ncbi:uncharacterized protein LOC134288558 [Aedes albopictus]|uniref:DUF5641 domain-containing protein n=1 Tax=Aedes albopictus TaxID=7160 RepID=A0ABM1XMG7_AEDAL
MADSHVKKTLGAYVHPIRFKFATKEVVQKLNVLLFGVEGQLNRYRANVINFAGFRTKNELEDFHRRLDLLSEEEVPNIAEVLNGDAAQVSKQDLYQLIAKLGPSLKMETDDAARGNQSTSELGAKRASSASKSVSMHSIQSTSSTAVEEAEKELELTKKILELERSKMEVEHNLKLKEIENKILQAKLVEQDHQSEAESLCSLESSTKRQFQKVNEWMDKNIQCGQEETPVQLSVHKEIPLLQRHVQPSVYETPPSSRLEKLLARQILGFELPRFAGNPEEWPSFITVFRRSTEDGEFSDAENMMRLRKCLEGPAKESVEMLLLTNDVRRTLDVLERNYGDSKVILQKVMDKVANFKFVHDPKSFLEFSNLVENVTVIMGSFDAKVHDVEAVLEKLLQKLPDYLRIQTAEHQIEKCPVFTKMDLNRRWDAARKFSLCFLCLTKHNTKCTSSAVCGLNECNRRHHKMLHRMEPSNPLGAVVEDQTRSAILKYVPVRVSGPKGTLSTTAFIDDGSSLTLIEADVAAAIGVTGCKSPVSFTWTGNIRREEEDSEIVQLNISADIPGWPEYELDCVHTLDGLNIPYQQWDTEKLLQKYPYLSSIDPRSISGSQPTILIGQNNGKLIVPREHYAPDGQSPIISKTRLGWVVHGPVVGLGFRLCGSEEDVVNVCVDDQLAELNELVRSSMSLDNFGVCVSNANNQRSVDDVRALDIAKSTVNKVGERYEIGLPYISDDIVMERSLHTAMRNLDCVEKRLQRQGLTEQYRNIVESYHEKGYVVKVPWRQVDWSNGKLWFLPHFPVLNVHKPGKIRMVFNSAAKSNGKCLNDYLLSGPPSGVTIFGILGRFRRYPVAVGADVTEMFHQVMVREEDTWSQCFLYRESPSDRPQVYRMNVMIFGANCSPFLAQFVKNHNAEQHKHEHPEAASDVIEQHYVDDYYQSFENVEQASQSRVKWKVAKENMKVGDVVKMADPKVPRGEWPLGRVVKVYTGDDGLVRYADVRTQNTTLRRPVTKLAVIEGLD